MGFPKFAMIGSTAMRLSGKSIHDGIKNGYRYYYRQSGQWFIKVNENLKTEAKWSDNLNDIEIIPISEKEYLLDEGLKKIVTRKIHYERIGKDKVNTGLHIITIPHW